MWLQLNNRLVIELVSKELNHFGVIAGLFRQIGGHSSRFVLFCSFWRLFTIKMIKSVKVFPFSFEKYKNIFIFTSEKSNLQHKHAKWPPSDLTPWTLTLGKRKRLVDLRSRFNLLWIIIPLLKVLFRDDFFELLQYQT